MSKILYFFKESLISSRRNLGTTIGGIITIFLSLLMIGVTIVFSIMIGNLAQSFEDEVNVRLYISDNATDEQIQALDDYLGTLTNTEGNIASVDFRNKDQVLQDFTNQTTNNPDIVNQLDGNPLPRTYVITLVDTKKVHETVDKILSSDTFTSIADNSEDPSDSVKYGQGTVERLFAVTNLIRYACVVVVVLLVFISLVFLNNTIRLAILARRREISIMRLVGHQRLHPRAVPHGGRIAGACGRDTRHHRDLDHARDAHALARACGELPAALGRPEHLRAHLRGADRRRHRHRHAWLRHRDAPLPQSLIDAA